MSCNCRGSLGLVGGRVTRDWLTSLRVRHNRQGIITIPPHPEHRRGGPAGRAGSISCLLATSSRSRRLPLAIAPTVPRLTPRTRAILRWL